MNEHIDLAAELAGLSQGVLSSPRKSDSPTRIRLRRIGNARGDWQIEEQRGAQAFHQNFTETEIIPWLEARLGTVYARAHFEGSQGTMDILSNRRGELKAIRGKAPGLKTAPEYTPVPEGHNRTKNYILPEGRPIPFLIDLGVMTAEGNIIAQKYDKFRQINRFLEFIADIADELDSARGERELRVVDFGCGKSYLTFAAYYYLHTLRGIPVQMTGLDLKEEVIGHCSALAHSYGYEELSFQVGDIAGWKGTDQADLVITLHACDTATDAALAQAVHWGAKAILSVPCCQHELNNQLRENRPSPGRDILKPALTHGIIRERMAALFTDALRAELLENAGYSVQVLEFIDMSHTPKNLLIRALRRDSPSAQGVQALNPAYLTLRDFLGVSPSLEEFLKAIQKKNGSEER